MAMSGVDQYSELFWGVITQRMTFRTTTSHHTKRSDRCQSFASRWANYLDGWQKYGENRRVWPVFKSYESCDRSTRRQTIPVCLCIL
jgi:hypothetical protein